MMARVLPGRVDEDDIHDGLLHARCVVGEDDRSVRKLVDCGLAAGSLVERPGELPLECAIGRVATAMTITDRDDGISLGIDARKHILTCIKA